MSIASRFAGRARVRPAPFVRAVFAGGLLSLAGVVGLAGGLLADRLEAQAKMPFPQIWTGRMLVPEGVEPGVTGDSFELRIFQASTDEEVSGLLVELQKGGQAALRNAMFQLKPKGWIRIGKLAATDAVVLRVVDLPDGQRRVRFFADHPLRLYDKTDPAGAYAHPFAYLELVIDGTGTGTGALIAAASLGVDAGELKMESAGLPVIRVYDVQTDSPPPKQQPAAPPQLP
jgi:hypothetical protein